MIFEYFLVPGTVIIVYTPIGSFLTGGYGSPSTYDEDCIGRIG